jgi:TPP-dependent 2-oxoacid decarboxylase
MTNIYNIHNSLNDIFNSAFSNIYLNNKIIKSEISERNLVYYKFKYSEINKTKQNIVSAINYKNNTTHNVTSYYRKEQHLSIDTYSNILTDINKLYLSLCPTTTITNNKLISIDGTYGNTNIQRKKGKLQTTLFMCYYDVTNSVPIDINFKNNKKNDNNRNNEVALAQKWINTNKSKCNNSIIIADRAYHKIKFFKFLISNNIKFVIRIKNNSNNDNLNKLNNC